MAFTSHGLSHGRAELLKRLRDRGPDAAGRGASIAKMLRELVTAGLITEDRSLTEEGGRVVAAFYRDLEERSRCRQLKRSVA